MNQGDQTKGLLEPWSSSEGPKAIYEFHKSSLSFPLRPTPKPKLLVMSSSFGHQARDLLKMVFLSKYPFKASLLGGVFSFGYGYYSFMNVGKT